MFTGMIDSSIWFLLLPVAVMALAGLFPAQHYIHIFQLESYKRPQFFLRAKLDQPFRKSLRKHMNITLLVFLGLSLLLLGASRFLFAFDLYVPLLLAAVLVTGTAMLLLYRSWKRQPTKKPLKTTARVVRLNVALAVVLVLYQWLLCALALVIFIGVYHILSNVLLGNESALGRTVMVGVVLISALVYSADLPRLLAFASFLVQPVENAVKNHYLADARRKLESMPDLIKIGITGSYGKTSAKVILATILSEKYKTYATPMSYNTPMGLTRAIREQLEPGHQVFVAEMGARHMGDIAELCQLVRPKYGLLTSVGPQHLETMFTMENVAKTKYELIESLPPDGMAFFPCDNEIGLNLYHQTEKPKALFGFGECGETLYMSAGGIAHGQQGSTFTLTGPSGETVQCATRLLGRHNVQNILGAAAVAHTLGLTMQEIARGIAAVEPVEHRLQLIPTNNGITVIDDAFNSNPAGARAALAVLKEFPGRKIVVTPGLVELGPAGPAENEAFGRAMAAVADIAILVASNAADIKRGLLAAGFDEGNVIVTGKLSEATAALGKLTRAGDVILFENDLPDHYET